MLTKKGLKMEDLKGMIRKKRERIGFISAWFASMFLGILFNMLDGIILVSILFLFAFITYEAIKAFSTYQIDTWTHSKHVRMYLFIGCFGGIVTGGIVYFYLRYRELESNKHGRQTDT